MKKELITTTVINKDFCHYLGNFQSIHKGYFFAESSMRFFKSKVYDNLYYDRFFITSEKYQDENRTYTIRVVCPSDSIETIGEFQKFSTKAAAEKYISKFLNKEIADIINLVRVYVNTNKYKKNVQSYINKNQKAFNSIIDDNLMSDYFDRYLNKFKA